MSFTQLTSPIPVDVIGKGKGLAFAVIDYGPEHNLIWVSALDESGEIWCAPNPSVRLRDNWTMGRARRSGKLPISQTSRWSEPDTQPEPSALRDLEARHAQALPIPGSDLEHAAFP
jgi:hypothetical protein